MINFKSSVLIVDDEVSNIDVLAGILSSDYKVKAAKSGKRALEIVQSKDKPDIILLDIMMPDMDGYQVIQELKANPFTASIPVIFVSAKSEIEDETKGFELGAVDYISKPVSPPIVKARVKTHIELSHLIHMISSQREG